MTYRPELTTPPESFTFAAAASDTVRERLFFPGAGTQVETITVGAIGTAPTAGTVGITKGIAASGNTMLSAATFTLSGLTDNTGRAMTLTGTVADIQGDAIDGITIEVVNSDGDIVVNITFKKQ